MHYLITGGTGYIGGALIPVLLADGHAVTVLSRQGMHDEESLRFVNSLDVITAGTRIDVVINLAGASLAGKRWTPAYKQEIFSSRLAITEGLLQLMARLDVAPEVLLSASAIGFYGHHGDEQLTEEGAVVPGFAHHLCRRWETAAMRATELGVRVCLLRLGVVLGQDGGALEEMARPYNFGVASWLGSGGQWLSWVHRRDAVAAIRFLQQHTEVSGPFNITAPEPVTSRGFCLAMKQCKRTFITLPMPAPVMRLLVGEMADELLLNGQRVLPSGLQAAGFGFAFPTLDAALADIF
tara:strand:- start:75007 stop:75891 length:885 start_codon:yes stop_codon:yes gene_type:complete